MAQARKVDAFDEEYAVVEETGRVSRPGRALVVRVLRHRTYGDLRVEARFFRVRASDGREFATPQGFVVTPDETEQLIEYLSQAGDDIEEKGTGRWD